MNSTVACALVASKISFDASDRRPLIAHVEAGLRSFDSAMPEEINRVVTDHLSDLLFVTEESGVQNLHREGIGPEKIHFVGNTMIEELLADGAMFFSAHHRTQKRIGEFGLDHLFQSGTNGDSGRPGIHLLGPLGYLDFLCLMTRAAIVVTDSGGIQEETTCLMVPCVTVRENTERPVTVSCGTNVIAGTSHENIRRVVREQMTRKMEHRVPEMWDGSAAGRIVKAIAQEFQKMSGSPTTGAESELLSTASDTR